MKKTVFLLVMALALVGSAVAQKSMSNDIPGIPPVLNPIDGNAVGFFGQQSAPAVLDELNNIYRGNTYVLVSDDKDNLSGLTVSVDFVAVEGQPGVYTVANGSWTLIVYAGDRYVGTLYGTISDGVVTDRINDESYVENRNIRGSYVVTGSMDGMEFDPAEPRGGQFMLSMDCLNESKAKAFFSNLMPKK